MPSGSSQDAQDELTDLMTVLYMLIQHALVYPDEFKALSLSMSWSPCPLSSRNKIWSL